MTNWKAIAEQNKIPYSTFKSRINRDGWSPDDAATKPPRRRREPVDPKWLETAKSNGINYYTFWSRIDKQRWTPERAATTPVGRSDEDLHWIAVAEENDIKYDTFWNRVNRLGWTTEKAATTPLSSAREFKRREDQEFIELASQNGINYDTYLSRVERQLMYPEEAATIPPMSKVAVLELAQELRKEYDEIRHDRINKDPDNLFKLTPQHIERAEMNGIPKATVHSRIYIGGWTVNDAITIPSQRGFEKPDGYTEWLEIAKNNGISQTVFRDRISLGWKLDTAAQTPKITKKPRSKYCQEKIDQAASIGVSYSTYKGRMRNGWTEEEAATTPILPSGKFLNEERAENVRNGYKRFRGLKD